MDGDIKIICTIGPATKNDFIMKQLYTRNVSMTRINLSHLEIEDIEGYILFLKNYDIPIAIDTEGPQIRLGNIRKQELLLEQGSTVYIHRSKNDCDTKNIYFTPSDVIEFFLPGTLIFLDFNSVMLVVDDITELDKENRIKCRVIIGGQIESKKGVHCQGINIKLPAFTEKDLHAIKLAKKYGIKYFTLSFVRNKDEIEMFNKLYPNCIVYAKIENIEGVKNISSILDSVDGILIDRGDLSREIPIQKIPLAQKILIEMAKKEGKEVLIASNLLETMSKTLKPSRSEANDIVNSVIDGVSGFVLTKETAVGKFPVETVNMLEVLIREGKRVLASRAKIVLDDLKGLGEINYLLDDTQGLLIRPHGGRLIENYLTENEKNKIDWERIKILEVDGNILMDIEQIGIGTYSPLEGFLCSKDLESVVDQMRLCNGVAWPIPIILTVNEEQKNQFCEGEKISIVSKGEKKPYAIMDIEEIYSYDKYEFAKKIFGTIDIEHPGVRMLNEKGDYILGGKIKLIRMNERFISKYNLTPRQVRSIFEALDWTKIVGFHTRNVVHRGHEYIQMQALEITGSDGLFVHPVVGMKKEGDFTAETIIRSYEIMLEKYYPRNKVVFGLLVTYSRYAGPREAIFTALCRQNYGCSHFIVGRDHTGVKNFYKPEASQEMFKEFKDLEIVPVFFDEIGYSMKLGNYIEKNEAEGRNIRKISGTEIRDMLVKGIIPPEWCMRKEISEFIVNELISGRRIFV